MIAKIFRYVKFSENIGSGFDKMIKGWKEQYKISPIIEGDFDHYKITFPFNKTTNKREDYESEILNLLVNNPFLSMFEISQKLRITSYNVQYYMNKLKENNRIERIGSKKIGKWKVIC